MMKRSYRYFIPVVTLLIACISALSPFATDTFLSAMPAMAEYFGVKINMIEFAITFYFIGFAVGQFFGGPLSDSFGRKRMATIGLFIYGISVVGIPWCKSIEMVWALRILQAIGGGFASVTNMAYIRDWFEGKQFARLASILTMVMMLAPLVAPLIGGLLMKDNNWGLIFFFMATVALTVLILVLLILPESKKREELSYSLTRKQLLGKYKLILASKPTVFLVLSLGFSMAAMFAFITTSSFIYLEYFHVESSDFFVFFASGVTANIVLTIANTILLKYFEIRSILLSGLYLQLTAATILLVVSLLSLPPFVLVFSMLVIIVGSLGLIFSNGTALVLDTFPQIGGAANAVVGVVRFTISSIVCSLISYFHTTNLIPIGIGIFFTVLVSNLLFRLSNRSKIKQMDKIIEIKI
ncbi:MAG: multidrug effflux MFS transporter [Paludibacter sp.]|nr:multidrug effflux MFS transporter [Paludibacter sp.]